MQPHPRRLSHCKARDCLPRSRRGWMSHWNIPTCRTSFYFYIYIYIFIYIILYIYIIYLIRNQNEAKIWTFDMRTNGIDTLLDNDKYMSPRFYCRCRLDWPNDPIKLNDSCTTGSGPIVLGRRQSRQASWSLAQRHPTCVEILNRPSCPRHKKAFIRSISRQLLQHASLSFTNPYPSGSSGSSGVWRAYKRKGSKPTTGSYKML